MHKVHWICYRKDGELITTGFIGRFFCSTIIRGDGDPWDRYGKPLVISLYRALEIPENDIECDEKVFFLQCRLNQLILKEEIVDLILKGNS